MNIAFLAALAQGAITVEQRDCGTTKRDVIGLGPFLAFYWRQVPYGDGELRSERERRDLDGDREPFVPPSNTSVFFL